MPAIPCFQQSATHGRASDLPANDGVPRSDEPTPRTHNINGRNLIVCIDGSTNQFGGKDTNVMELYRLVLKEDRHNQIAFFNRGVGKYAHPSRRSLQFIWEVILHKIDMAMAWNFEKPILDAYQWLSNNYEKGDRIFMFGFSRGAYQVRVLSAMIDKVGLIRKEIDQEIPFTYKIYVDPKSELHTVTRVGSEKMEENISIAYKIYVDPKSELHTVTRVGSEEMEEKISMAQWFNRTFSHSDVSVHFVGAWDTDWSIGVGRGKNLSKTIKGMNHVRYFRHALPLDEQRVKPLAECTYRGRVTEPPEEMGDQLIAHNEPTNDKPPADNGAEANVKSENNRPHTIEKWFPGTHSDIGGKNVKNAGAGMDLSRSPLVWMVAEARALGLRMKRDLDPDEQTVVKDSFTPQGMCL
ncbi:hypothetical protein M413DRAFT_32248 [Hebeloma cylindrosporum]|uniref:T6SS Phospholipase effector Tle1-like catalytic domain-containing protein n=1 Tax=Hebeloma cylindrosporum TaxID=76867 RepID=A0A0C3BUN8_HEBCY|nr:hypothetical protein M413DRAFT_32248 [Hebeloma cylindrosporum h7]